MKEVPIVAPSLKRAESLEIVKWLPQAVIAVHEEEEKQYKKCNPEVEIVVIPSGVPRRINAVRQWIYDHFGDVYVTDDDLKAVTVVHRHPMRKLLAEEFVELVNHTADVARQAKAFLFGFSITPNPMLFFPQNPFKPIGVTYGANLGLLKGSQIFFDQDLPIAEDVFACLVNAYYHRMAFFDHRFALQITECGTIAGGCSTYRTDEMRKECYEKMVERFGSKIVHLTPPGKRPLPWDFTTSLPF